MAPVGNSDFPGSGYGEVTVRKTEKRDITQVHGLKNIYVHSRAVALFRPRVWTLHVDNFHRTVLIVFPGRWGRFRAS